MAVTFHIPSPLREFTGGQSEVEIGIAPATLGDALSALWILYPGLRDRVATEQGEIREHINIFVGNDDVRFTGGLTTRISVGSEISIVPAISGGTDLLQVQSHTPQALCRPRCAGFTFPFGARARYGGRGSTR